MGPFRFSIPFILNSGRNRSIKGNNAHSTRTGRRCRHRLHSELELRTTKPCHRNRKRKESKNRNYYMYPPATRRCARRHKQEIKFDIFIRKRFEKSWYNIQMSEPVSLNHTSSWEHSLSSLFKQKKIKIISTIWKLRGHRQTNRYINVKLIRPLFLKQELKSLASSTVRQMLHFASLTYKFVPVLTRLFLYKRSSNYYFSQTTWDPHQARKQAVVGIYWPKLS